MNQIWVNPLPDIPNPFIKNKPTNIHYSQPVTSRIAFTLQQHRRSSIPYRCTPGGCSRLELTFPRKLLIIGRSLPGRRCFIWPSIRRSTDCNASELQIKVTVPRRDTDSSARRMKTREAMCRGVEPFAETVGATMCRSDRDRHPRGDRQIRRTGDGKEGPKETLA